MWYLTLVGKSFVVELTTTKYRHKQNSLDSNQANSAWNLQRQSVVISSLMSNLYEYMMFILTLS